MSQPPIQVIPTGQTAIKGPRHAFTIAMLAQKDVLKYQREINKTLPIPRNRK